MKTYNEYKELQSSQTEIVAKLSAKLNSYPKNSLGMIVENIRISLEYKDLKAQFSKEFQKLQTINSLGQKLFKKEILKARKEKRTQRYIN